MKKSLFLVLVALMLLSLFTMFASAENEFAFKKFDDMVEVHIGRSVSPTDTSLAEGDTADNNYYTRFLLDNYNIKVVLDWTAANGPDFNQKVALCIASDTLPDVIILPERSYFMAAVDAEQLYDLKPLYDKYASDQFKSIYATTNGQAEEKVTFDGKMLALPTVSVGADGINVLMVQENWLVDLGLEVPKTISELYEVLVAIRDAKPAGERTIPLLGPDKNGRVYNDFLHSYGGNQFDPIFAAMDAYPGFFVADEEGKVHYGSLTDETRATLEILAQWYAEGLIDPEVATRDSSSDVLNANECGFFCGPWYSIGYGTGDSFKNSEEADWQAYPLYTEDGRWNTKMKTLGNSYTVVNRNASEEVAAAVIIMTNVLVAHEVDFQSATAEDIDWYPLRTVLAAMDECEYTYKALISVLEGETEPEDWTDEPSYKLLAGDVAVTRSIVTGYTKGEQLHRKDFLMTPENETNYQRQYSQLIGIRPAATVPIDSAVYSATYALNDTMDRYWPNLETLENTVIRSIITGKSDIAAFDDFVEQWLAEGGEKILESVQAEYDATK